MLFWNKRKVYELWFTGEHLFDVIDLLCKDQIGDCIRHADSNYSLSNNWNYIQLSATPRQMARAERMFAGIAKIVKVG